MWLTIKLDNGVVHVVPLEDTWEHVFHEDCWCHPQEDPEDLHMVHTSADGREKYEDGTAEWH